MNMTRTLKLAYKFAQQSDPELASPEIKVEPADTLVQKAVDMLKKINPSYFVGVRKIVISTSSAYGFVESGPGKDPAIIHINLSKIKSDVQSKYGGMGKEQMEQEIAREIASVISHERGHISSYNPQQGFVGGEGPAEQEEKNMAMKLK